MLPRGSYALFLLSLTGVASCPTFSIPLFTSTANADTPSSHSPSFGRVTEILLLNGVQEASTSSHVGMHLFVAVADGKQF